MLRRKRAAEGVAPLQGSRRRRRHGAVGCALAVAGAGLLAVASPRVAAESAQGPTFASDVAPILSRHCLACHSSGTKMGGLVLDSLESLEMGGNRGPSFVRGDSGRSPLYLMVAGKMEPRMPFSAGPLGPADVEVLKRWIDSGASAGTQVPDGAIRAEVGSLPPIEPSGSIGPQIFSLAFHPGGRLIAAGRHGGVALTDAATGQTTARLEGLSDIARAVAFSPDGRLLAAGGGRPQIGGEVRIWSVEEGREVVALQGHADTIQALAFAPDGKMLATASYDKDIKLWDVSSGEEIRTLRDHIDAVYSLAFTPDGSRLVSGSADRSVKVWDPSTGDRLYTLGEPTDGINSVAIDPTGPRVAAGGHDRTIRVWRLGEDGGELLNVLIAHQSAILRIAYSPDGRRIVTSAADRSLKVFDSRTLNELGILEDQSDWVMSLAFSLDGERLAAGRFDGSLSIYDRASHGGPPAVGSARKLP